MSLAHAALGAKSDRLLGLIPEPWLSCGGVEAPSCAWSEWWHANLTADCGQVPPWSVAVARAHGGCEALPPIAHKRGAFFVSTFAGLAPGRFPATRPGANSISAVSHEIRLDHDFQPIQRYPCRDLRMPMLEDQPAQICSVEDCGKPSFQRGWCSAHWHRWQRYGDPLAGGPERPPRQSAACSVPNCGKPSTKEASVLRIMRAGSATAILLVDWQDRQQDSHALF